MGGVFLVSMAIGLLIGLTSIWKLFDFIWRRPNKVRKFLKQQGITGPPYKPFIGNLDSYDRKMEEALSKPINLSHQIVNRLEPYLCDVAKVHGNVSVTWLGPYARVNIMDPDMVKEIMFNKFDQVEKVKINPLMKLVAPGVAIYDGAKWATHRKIINPAFHLQKLKVMFPSFYTSCSELVDRWSKMTGSKGSCELDVRPDLQFLTGDAISRAAFGSSYREGMQIFQLLREQARLFSKIGASACFPGYRFLPTRDNFRMKEIERRVRALLREMIGQREKAMDMGQYSCSNDLLGLLLESNARDSKENGRHSSRGTMTIEEVIDECKLFYFAGQDTTSVLLIWTLIVLSMHPEWQTRAREEVLCSFGRHKPDFEGVNNLKLMTMILYEIMRLYPPVTFLVRSTFKETSFRGVRIPAGVLLSMHTLLIQRDRELWGEDAEEFKPERFAGGIARASKNQAAFIPFGFGPRICMGQNFVMIEAKLALAMILREFSFELSPAYLHAPHTVMTMQPQHGAQIILRKI